MKVAAFPEKRAARRSFERAAATYDSAAVLHREVGERLLQHLDPIRIDPALAVDLGCGTGFFLRALARRYPRAQLVGVDLALPMLERARSRTPWWRRALGERAAHLVCGDAEKIPLATASSRASHLSGARRWSTSWAA